MAPNNDSRNGEEDKCSDNVLRVTGKASSSLWTSSISSLETIDLIPLLKGNKGNKTGATESDEGRGGEADEGQEEDNLLLLSTSPRFVADLCNATTEHHCLQGQQNQSHHPSDIASSSLLEVESITTKLCELTSEGTSSVSEVVAQEPVASGKTLSSWTVLMASKKSIRTRNPIREIVDPILAEAAARATSTFIGNVDVDNVIDGKKDLISLALGDPTVFGNLPPCPVAINAIVEAVQSTARYHCANYVDACGSREAREAIATYHHRYKMGGVDSHSSKFSYENVIIANGCSGALDIALTALLHENAVLLLPNPGFPLYQVIAESNGFCNTDVCVRKTDAGSSGGSIVHYPLLPEKNWEIDIQAVYKILVDVSTRYDTIVFVITNPSNPAGSVYSANHLNDIIQVCENFPQTVLLADEVYGDLVFSNDNTNDNVSVNHHHDNENSSEKRCTTYDYCDSTSSSKKQASDKHHQYMSNSSNHFHPIAAIATARSSNVPVITASGLSKQYLLPGWRIGWIVFQDNPNGSLKQVLKGAKQLAQLILGSSNLIQAVIPKLLCPVSISDQICIKQWKMNVCRTLQTQANFLYNELQTLRPGLIIESYPAGAMYMLVRINVEYYDDTISNDIDFTKLLLQEENVFVLPGSCFFQNTGPTTISTPSTTQQNANDVYYYFRVVFCAPIDTLQVATERIRSFSSRHTQQ